MHAENAAAATSIPAPAGPESGGLLAEIEANWRQRGDTFDIPLQGLRAVVLTHPRDVRRTLTDANYADKGPIYDGVRQVIGDGVLTSGGDKWKASRRIMTPAFHHQQIAAMVDTMSATGATFIDNLCERTKRGEVIDLQEEMTALTLSTLLAAMFGQHQPEATELSYATLSSAFKLAGNLGGADTMDPAMGQQYADLTQQLDEFAQNAIDTARRSRPDDSLLSLLAHAKDAETGTFLPDAALRDELLTIVFAGHETTALTLTWLYALLNGREDITSRLRSEATAVLGNGTPDLEKLPRLTYTRQVIDEVLRLRPAVPMIARVAQAADCIVDVAVRPNDVVLPFLYGTHRHPVFWDHPDTFDPERFAPAAIASRDKWSYLPFAGGNRICLGKHFALTELTVHAALFMQRAQIDIEADTANPALHMTLRPSVPIFGRVAALR